MSDLRTIVKKLLREVHINSAASGSQAEIDAKIAVFKAIRHNKKYRLGFNERWHVISLETNEDRYSLPSDYIGMVQDYVYSVPSNEYLHKARLRSLPLSRLNLITQSGLANPAYRETGPPYAYSVDLSSNEIVILPTPATSDDLIEFLYLSDLGTPDFTYTGSAWKFYYRGTTEEIGEDWTNEWLDEAKGYELVYARAAYMMLSRNYGGTPEAAQKAQDFLMQWSDMLETLRAEARLSRGVTEIVKHIR